MKFEDLLGLGKILPIDKLMDLVSKSVGRISKSYFDKKDVDTKAYEIKKLAEARAEEIKIISKAVKENFKSTGGIQYKENQLSIDSPEELPASERPKLISPPIEERTQNRIDYQEAKKQLNIESITSFAADELKEEQPVTDEPVDEDWATRFFRYAEDISNEEMQALWGRILAGEIKQPKTYSLRTLELIRNLSRDEANTFMKIANFAVQGAGNNYIFKGKGDDTLQDKFGISFRDIALLTEIGLIQSGSFIYHQYLTQPVEAKHHYIAGNIIIFVTVKANTPKTLMPVYLFTKSGNELLKLIKPNPPIEYLASFAQSIMNDNIDVKYAHILAWEENGQIRHTQPLLEFENKEGSS